MMRGYCGFLVQQRFAFRSMEGMEVVVMYAKYARYYYLYGRLCVHLLYYIIDANMYASINVL
jgi:hypothetical protein